MTDTTETLLMKAAENLKRAGIRESRNEAEIILSAVMGVKRFKLYLRNSETLPPGIEKEFKNAVKLREKRCPVSYITGKKEFYGYEFFVSPEVLIPRPETEFVIEAVMDRVKAWGRPEDELSIIDLGTGSGAIVITLALLLPGAAFRAVDISAGALEIARKNAVFHRVDNRIKFSKGNYWEALDENVHPFDIVVSNPPYIPAGEIDRLSPEIKRFEPRQALDGGEDGLDGYRKILKGLDSFASRPAALILETGADSFEAVKNLCLKEPYIKSVESWKDYRGYDRVLTGIIG